MEWLYILFLVYSLSNKGLFIKLFNFLNSVGMKQSGASFDNGDMVGRNPRTIVI